MIYFDNSATTRTKPKQVISEMVKGLTKYSANSSRSSHSLALESALQVNLVREKVKKFFDAEDISNVVFTSNCTEALNMAILGSAQENGHIVYTSNEHNSVLRPLFHLNKEKNIALTEAKPQEDELLKWEDISKHIQPNTYLVCVNHISNVDGMRADIKKIGAELKKLGILFLVDAAQSAGHERISMQDCNISFLAISPHKGLYAPQGIGLLILGKNATVKPIKFGGTGTESYNLEQPTSLPESLESGTLALPNILALGAAIDFVKDNFDEINEKIEDLITYLNFELRKLDNIIVYTNPNNCCGVLSFNIKGLTSEEVGVILNEKYKICTRSGLHCAPLKHILLGTVDTGTVRVSLSYHNNFTEISTLIKAVKQIAKSWYVSKYKAFLTLKKFDSF